VDPVAKSGHARHSLSEGGFRQNPLFVTFRPMSRSAALSLVILLSLFGLLLRAHNLEHGRGHHPDERHMVMVTEAIDFSENLNPKSFAYGSFPYYLNRAAAEAVAWVTGERPHYENLFVVGRSLSVGFGVMTILLSYWLAVSLYADRFVGVIAATFTTLNVLHIQLSRFFAVDIMLAALALGALCIMTKLVESGKLRWYALAGVVCGIALGTKLSGLLLLAPLGGAFIVLLINATNRGRQGVQFVGLLLALVCFVAAFLAVEPFAWLDFHEFVRQNREQADMARGARQLPYTIQYVGTTPFLYPLEQMFRYTMGPFLALSVFAGVLYALARHAWFSAGAVVRATTDVDSSTVRSVLHALTYAPRGELLILIWILVVYFSTAGLLVKYPRYLLPLYPELFILAAVALRDLGQFIAIQCRRYAFRAG
jgi:4-amino-4-deoxy-L-arabinose transferase-like glycosyltransferase